MEINGVEIEDTYAEAFPIKIARILITAATKRWALVAATEATGFATSVIMCPAEAGIERLASPSETPDGRPGVYIQICTFKYEALKNNLISALNSSSSQMVWNPKPRLQVARCIKFQSWRGIS